MTSKQTRKFQLPALLSGPLPLISLREQARRGLIDLIDSTRGTKALILDPNMSGSLSLLDASLPELLTEHGVVKLLHLEAKPLDDPVYNASDVKLAELRNVIYIARSTVENAQIIAAQIKTGVLYSKSKKQGVQDFSVFLVPRKTIACTRVFEEEGVMGDMTLNDFSLDMVALEDDVISLELEMAFKDCVADGDSSTLYLMAKALTKLQAMFGLIPRIQGKGPAAIAVRDMCIRMRREAVSMGTGSGQLSLAPLISRAILIDREVDIVTPMMTQTTFEGLVDEVSGIRHGSVLWKQRDKQQPVSSTSESISSKETSRNTIGSTLLNSSDPFYKEFRDLPYHVAVQRLQFYARDARREYAELGSKDLSELKTFVKGLPKVLMLDRLTDIATPVAEEVKQSEFHERLKQEFDIVEGFDTEASVAYLEGLLGRGADIVDVLRMVVLLNECHQGLSKKHFDFLRHDILQSYGHEHLLTLSALERAGFLRVAAAAGKGTFKELRKGLRLTVPEEVNNDSKSNNEGLVAAGSMKDSNPTDVSAIYRGYAPITIRLVEQALQAQSWSALGEVMSLLPGSQFDIVQTVDASNLPVEYPFKGLNVQRPQATVVPTFSSKPQRTAASGTGVDGKMRSSPQSEDALEHAPRQPEVVLVVFIGGVTYSEISALRFVSSQSSENNYRFVVLTTGIVNGRSLIKTFIDPTTGNVASCVGLH
ncbi:hypothetical protein CEUSTIGMA_g7111.t1 [Chlamydomonas eustigma]|uniref:Sec1-like protein n=1 Tax=Chlamydomonas eustigma TaxID=1157962 RepID=A0A250XA82_9CHLO|nr:hypothetical protein CEUSTIGMA_g7111.t1 [Chlamydomonas eustigma]|eukprot:GAX79670.1 hypothetical protein CEUSTIGMA_g7111.t1 [Chlamydomonas eustigma]